MVFIFIKAIVKDYKDWEVGFKSHSDIREKYGCTGVRVYQEMQDSNSITMVFEWTDIDGFNNFMSDPKVKSKIQALSAGPPTMTIMEHKFNQSN